MTLDRAGPLVVDRAAGGDRAATPTWPSSVSSSVGLDESARSLPVDDHLRVIGAEGLWAVGDITGKGAFTHVSMYQADIVVAGTSWAARWSRPTTGRCPG